MRFLYFSVLVLSCSVILLSCKKRKCYMYGEDGATFQQEFINNACEGLWLTVNNRNQGYLSSGEAVSVSLTAPRESISWSAKLNPWGDSISTAVLKGGREYCGKDAVSPEETIYFNSLDVDNIAELLGEYTVDCTYRYSTNDGPPTTFYLTDAKVTMEPIADNPTQVQAKLISSPFSRGAKLCVLNGDGMYLLARNIFEQRHFGHYNPENNELVLNLDFSTYYENYQYQCTGKKN